LLVHVFSRCFLQDRARWIDYIIVRGNVAEKFNGDEVFMTRSLNVMSSIELYAVVNLKPK